MSASSPIDWSRITLVVFDIDGTLYAQRPLRMRMAASLARHSIRTRSMLELAVLRSYRTLRERYGDQETEDFGPVLIDSVARRHGCDPTRVAAIVEEWINVRPLEFLARHRYPELDRLFGRIRASGRAIGVLSDYPAQAKMDALGLRADHVVTADDVGMLKPHPRGLERVMELAGVSAERTVLIGDRAERDGEAARRAGAASLLRSTRPIAGALTFARYDDPIFVGLDTGPVDRSPDYSSVVKHA
ncbi:HAD family hydrolase [uncultured Sphingomonas sp.]|uniref:HAD family hydrolase n=1 Tax=uncultured Sphingomonas sp. TaxID=158754 RepID=UPI0035C9B79E